MAFDSAPVAKLFDESTSDDENKRFIATHADHPWPGLATAGQAALTTRSIDRLANAIRKFQQSSDRYSARIQWLTGALVVLTIILAIPEVRNLLTYLR